MKMGNINSGKKLYNVDESFFKRWGPNMAYILGFTVADGNLYRKTLSWDLTNKSESNLILLNKFNKVIKSNYPVVRNKFSFRLRISNKTITEDLLKLGIVPNKTKIMIFPDVPKNLLKHFLRGFLDGDGWISIRKKVNYSEICVGFSNGSYLFMKKLVEVLRNELGISDFNLRCRKKKTMHGNLSKTYQIDFYSENAFKIISFLYSDLSNDYLFLERKYIKSLDAIKLFEKMKSLREKGKNWVNIENKYGKNMNLLLDDLVLNKKKLPKNVALELGISLSTLYRWLNKSEVRIFEKRGSNLWSERIVSSKRLNKNER